MGDERVMRRDIESTRARLEAVERRVGSLPSRIPHVRGGGFGGDIEELLEQLLELFETVINGKKLAVWHIVDDYEALLELAVSAPALGFTEDTGTPWVLHERPEGEGSTTEDEDPPWIPLGGLVVDSLEDLEGYELSPPSIGYTRNERNYWARAAEDGEWEPFLRETGDWP